VRRLRAAPGRDPVACLAPDAARFGDRQKAIRERGLIGRPAMGLQESVLLAAGQS
jgi:hypothetical protein